VIDRQHILLALIALAAIIIATVQVMEFFGVMPCGMSPAAACYVDDYEQNAHAN
jgi:hypothetical protein